MRATAAVLLLAVLAFLFGEEIVERDHLGPPEGFEWRS